MRSILVRAALGLCVGAMVPACAANADEAKLGAETSSEADAVTLAGGTRVVGAMALGETRTVRYANPPRYAAYTFAADGGADVDVWVRAAGRDAMAWVLDGRGNVLAQNDDADGTTLDAHVHTRLPAGARGTYRIAFREYSLRAASFTVELRGAPDYAACAADADCVATGQAGCCNGWRRVALNASMVDAYHADGACRPPYPSCAPPPDVEDARVPLCNAGSHQCELVAPTDISCGGFVRNPRTCPAGYECYAPEAYRDIPGHCVAATGCDYDGQRYAVGAGFPSSDGCNTCSCAAGGRVVCTLRACPAPCDPALEPNRRYVGTPEVCMRIRFACEAGTHMFSSACGCGCEND